jgi:hypothetical protein
MAGEMSSITEEARAVIAPLGPEEERRAAEAALAHIRSDAPDVRVYGVEVAVAKPKRRGDAPARQVRVLLTAPGSSAVHEVLVDASGEVVALTEHPSLNLPYLPEEVDEARTIAERDDRVARLAEECRELGVGTFAPKSHGEGHRLVGLHYLDVVDPYLPKPLASVIVDLATEEVVSFREAGRPEATA